VRSAAISRHGGKMKDSDWGALLWLGLIILGGIGWICNIIEIAHAEMITGMIILRVVGIFMFPLGAVLGWL
jgi:hypothetical protein